MGRDRVQLLDRAEASPRTVSRRLAIAVSIASVCCGLVAGSIAIASASGKSTTYYACLHSGTLSKVGTSKPACPSGHKEISWNATGPIGAIGATGATGAKGQAGTKGAIGATGPRGSTGSVGATGSRGATGAVGSPGVGATVTYDWTGTFTSVGVSSESIPTGATITIGASSFTGNLSTCVGPQPLFLEANASNTTFWNLNPENGTQVASVNAGTFTTNGPGVFFLQWEGSGGGCSTATISFSIKFTLTPAPTPFS